MRNETILADDAREFVEFLNETAFFPQPNTQSYMKRYARWTAAVDQKLVRTDTPEHFVSDLKFHGYLKVEGNEYTLGGLQGLFIDTEYLIELKQKKLSVNDTEA